MDEEPAQRAISAARSLAQVVNAYRKSDPVSPHARSLLSACKVFTLTLDALDKKLSISNDINPLGDLLEQDASQMESLAKELDRLAESKQARQTVGPWQRCKDITERMFGRVSAVTCMLMQDNWKELFDQTLLDNLRDSEGQQFWARQILKQNREVKLQKLSDDMQKYLSAISGISTVPKLMEMVNIACKTSECQADAVISISEFDDCLARFGPLRDFIFKAAAVCTIDGARVEWFRNSKDVVAESAMKESKLPFIVYLGSERGEEFVCAFQLGDVCRKVSICNSALGYCVKGETSLYPNLVALIEKEIAPQLSPAVDLSSDVKRIAEWTAAGVPIAASADSKSSNTGADKSPSSSAGATAAVEGTRAVAMSISGVDANTLLNKALAQLKSGKVKELDAKVVQEIADLVIVSGKAGQPAIRQSYLEKRGNFNTSWKVRWCALSNSHLVLHYLKSPTSPKAQGSILLAGSKVVAEKEALTFSIQPVGSTRKFVFRAPTEEEAQKWLSTLQHFSNVNNTV